MRILKACTGIEAGDPEELPVALHAPIYPPRPHFLTFSPASDFHSGHAKPFFPFVQGRRQTILPAYWPPPDEGSASVTMQVPYLVSIASPSPGSCGSSTPWISVQFGASIVIVNLCTAH